MRRPPKVPDRDTIRPSVYVLAGLLAAISGACVWAATRYEPGSFGRDETAEADAHRGRGTVSWRDPSRGRPAAGGGAGGDYTHHDWREESAATRLVTLDLPSSTFWNDANQQVIAQQNDPQLFNMWRSFHYDANIDQETGETEPQLPFEPTASHATLVDSEGDVIADPSSCAVRVLPARAAGFNCLVRVMCDGEVLYPEPGQRAGYVACDLENGRPVRAVDNSHSSSDGDPQVDFDLATGTVTVADYDESGAVRYRATLRIQS
ncbi:MAG: hypothetical protein AB7S26_05210 [Sandaracinaceae bacterium]